MKLVCKLKKKILRLLY